MALYERQACLKPIRFLKPYGFCFVGLFSGRVRFGITGVGITLNDAKGSDAKFGITGAGITFTDAKGSDANLTYKALFG